MVEREAVPSPLDHATGFELADVRPAAIEMQREGRRIDGHSPLGDVGPSTVTVSAIVLVPVALSQDS